MGKANKQISRLAALLIIVSSPLAFSQPTGDLLPFNGGEVAVYGVPSDFPEYVVIRHYPFSGISVLEVERGNELAEVQRLRNLGFVSGLNHRVQASPSEKPLYVNDPCYPIQWNFRSVQSEEAWREFLGSPVRVAVLDSGLALGGNDGIECSLPGWDVVNGDDDPDDDNGHGTHVSGTVAQSTNNLVGVAGMAFQAACIMPVKVLNEKGSGSFAEIAEGIHIAVDNGARVINMSLGTNAHWRITNDPLIDPALDYASDNEVIVVCSAGNDRYFRNVGYPTTIAVGATNYLNELAQYTNSGEGLDIVAPGGDVMNDLNGDGYSDGILLETFVDGAWNYWFYQGTSMSAPHVSAAAAMLIASGAATTADEVRNTLSESALDLGDPGWDPEFGYGLLQVYDALTIGSQICTDNDGDRWCAESGDCDDDNAHVYPGHNDTRGRFGGDGIDNDCNDIIDG